MKDKKSTSILMLIMSVVIVCLSFGMFSFKFKNSQAIEEEVANAVSANGGAMYIGAGSTVTIEEDCEISGITGATNGGAIYVAGILYFSGTIRNCSATSGGAIYIANGGRVYVDGGSISGCSATNGGAIYVASGGSLVVDSPNGSSFTIDDCHATSTSSSTVTKGGAVYAASGATCDFDQNAGATILNCTAKYGGGIYYVSTNSRLYETSFESCSSTYAGGAVHTSEGYLEIINCSFDSCSSESDVGGAILSSNTGLTISYSSFDTCTAKGGGAIYHDYADLIIDRDVQFNDCSASTWGGGAIDACSPTIFSIGGTSSLPVSFNRCNANASSDSGGGAIQIYADEISQEEYGFNYVNFTSCSAGRGGGLYLSDVESIELDNTNFELCEAEQGAGVCSDGASFMHYSGSYTSCYADYSGGGIYSDCSTLTVGGDSQVSFSDCCANMADNDAGFGGSIYASQGNVNLYDIDSFDASAFYGAGLYLKDCSVGSLGGVIAEANASEDGGAIYMAGTTDVRITSLEINSTSGYWGGGIYAGETASFSVDTQLCISGCSAENGGGIYYAGGGEITLAETIIVECTAEGDGGGIYIPDGMMLTCDTVEIYDCVANEGGAIYMSIDAYIALATCDIYSNEATNGANIYVVGQTGIQIQSGTSITAPVTGNSIEIEDRADISIVAGAVVGSANPASNDRIHSASGREVYISYSGGSLYSIIDICDTEPSVNITFKPTVALTLEVGSTAQFSSSSNIVLSNIKSATSGYTPSASGTLVSLIQAVTYTITVNKSGSGGLSVNGVTQAKAQKTYSVTSGNNLLFTMTLSAPVGLTGPDGTTLWTYYGYRLKNSAGTQLSTGLNKNSYSTTKSYTFTPTKTETITVEFYTSDGNIGNLFISESLEETEKTQEQDIYFDDKKFLLKTVNINSQDLYSQEKYVINANRMEIA